jgi:phosphatidylserine decarboxylase
VPVSGKLTDFYTISGSCHSCNPAAVIATATPLSKNTRVVSIIDTDVPEGSGVGMVAMIEVAALMVGDIVQAYSEERYDNPRQMEIGMFLRKGRPKSLFRPGSSTDVLLFHKGRIEFSPDLTANCIRNDVGSRFSAGFGRPLVETDVKAGSVVAKAAGGPRT